MRIRINRAMAMTSQEPEYECQIGDAHNAFAMFQNIISLVDVFDSGLRSSPNAYATGNMFRLCDH